MRDLSLIIFDVDGTLVDSQHEIMAAMMIAHETVGVGMPERSEIIGRVGLSLPEFMLGLHPDRPDIHVALTQAYKDAFRILADRQASHPPPLFDGVFETLLGLAKLDHVTLGLATGKSLRGAARFIDQHGFQGMFTTIQTADENPSKPNPGMLLAAMAEAGAAPDRTVFVGDTVFDMQMARAAQVGAIGVSWGYHPASDLGADHILECMADLREVLRRMELL